MINCFIKSQPARNYIIACSVYYFFWHLRSSGSERQQRLNSTRGVHVLKHGHEQSERNLVKDRPIVSSISLLSPIQAFSG